MNRGVRRTQFKNLGTKLRDEAAVAGAAGGGKFRAEYRFLGRIDLLHVLDKAARRREERQAANSPLKVIVEAMPVENRRQPSL